MRDCALPARIGSARSPAKAHPAVQQQNCPHTCMSYFSTIDRESLQKLLANAYAVQQSQLDSQSLSAIVELQRVITRGNLDLDAALHLIVHRAQDVAQSTGTAIGLLKGNQLVYRAGSGSAAAYIGRSVTAS